MQQFLSKGIISGYQSNFLLILLLISHQFLKEENSTIGSSFIRSSAYARMLENVKHSTILKFDSVKVSGQQML